MTEVVNDRHPHAGRTGRRFSHRAYDRRFADNVPVTVVLTRNHENVGVSEAPNDGRAFSAGPLFTVVERRIIVPDVSIMLARDASIVLHSDRRRRGIRTISRLSDTLT